MKATGSSSGRAWRYGAGVGRASWVSVSPDVPKPRKSPPTKSACHSLSSWRDAQTVLEAVAHVGREPGRTDVAPDDGVQVGVGERCPHQHRPRRHEPSLALNVSGGDDGVGGAHLLLGDHVAEPNIAFGDRRRRIGHGQRHRRFITGVQGRWRTARDIDVDVGGVTASASPMREGGRRCEAEQQRPGAGQDSDRPGNAGSARREPGYYQGVAPLRRPRRRRSVTIRPRRAPSQARRSGHLRRAAFLALIHSPRILRSNHQGVRR